MPTLFCFGLGYTATHYAAAFHSRYDRVFGTVRNSTRAAEMNQGNMTWRTVLAFDGISTPPDVSAAIADSHHVLVSIPPDTSGDVVLATCATAISQAPQLRSVVYLSTIGVYGHHDGAWVDEESQCRPGAQRSLQRHAAEHTWQDFGTRAGVPVAILRLAGIYGPDQNALVSLKNGTARRIVKPGQIFNRIHVADIANAIEAAFERRADGIFNVADDEPSPPEDPIAFAASLLRVEAPPEIPFSEAQASMSPMGLSFYAEAKRAKNEKLKSVLGVSLEYPTYREGLTALHRDCQSGKKPAP
jgi:nucleoside-diphosphate-sugar epimerase